MTSQCLASPLTLGVLVTLAAIPSLAKADTPARHAVLNDGLQRSKHSRFVVDVLQDGV